MEENRKKFSITLVYSHFQEEENVEGIEKVNVSASEAFKQFKGKSLTAENIDFSDRVSKGRRTGYDVPNQSEYELVSVSRQF